MAASNCQFWRNLSNRWSTFRIAWVMLGQSARRETALVRRGRALAYRCGSGWNLARRAPLQNRMGHKGRLAHRSHGQQCSACHGGVHGEAGISRQNKLPRLLSNSCSLHVPESSPWRSLRVPQLPKCCPPWLRQVAPGAEIRPRFDQSWPMRANGLPMLAYFGWNSNVRCGPDVGRYWPKFNKSWPKPTNLGRVL